ncbi:MAG: hypothetical protein PHO41_02410 [Eubacteriales bacterium]|nr:hypothetical protein [Eubacteriales bacterium]
MKQNAASKRQALLDRAYSLFEEYRRAYAGEWRRLEAAERMYRGEHWYNVPQSDPKEPRPATPVLQSTVENIAADLMDQFPEAVITPETPKDTHTARVLEEVIRMNHDAASYIVEYRKLIHDLLVSGYMVQEVGYDPTLNRGLGGTFLRHTDVRGILFDPLVTDIQESRGIFKFCSRSRDWLLEHYPETDWRLISDAYSTRSIASDDTLAADRRDTLLLLEYWWRSYDAANKQYRVHMAILCGGKVLRDSRDVKPNGYYAHGRYPFVLTTLYPRKGCVLGQGIVDMFASQQRYADKLDQILLKNALMASHNKLLVTEASGFDPEDLSDWSREIHKGESLNGVTWFSTPPLPSYLMQYSNQLKGSIKEESGSNDFSRGGVASGVTAASAIAALQEMSSKRSRMATRQIHEAFREAVRMEIQVEREFSFLPRRVYVRTDGTLKEERFSAAMLECRDKNGKLLPIEFFVSIQVQQQTRWSRTAHNELIMQMRQLNIITGEQALELMQFDGREAILEKAREAQKQREAETEKLEQKMQRLQSAKSAAAQSGALTAPQATPGAAAAPAQTQLLQTDQPAGGSSSIARKLKGLFGKQTY